MSRVEVQMEALLMNEVETQEVRDRITRHRSRKNDTAIAQDLKDVATDISSSSVTHPQPPQRYGNLVPVERLPAPYLCQKKVSYKKSSSKKAMPVTRIGVPAPRKLNSDIPLQSYDEWKKTKTLPRAWKQTDKLAEENEEEEEDQETKIELPKSLQEREKMVDAALKSVNDAEIELPDVQELIPADIPVPIFPCKSFEKWPPGSSSTPSSSTLSTTESVPSVLSPDTSILSLTGSEASSSTTSSLAPPTLLIPETPISYEEKHPIIDALVLASDFAPSPVKKQPKLAPIAPVRKAKSDHALNRKSTSLPLKAKTTQDLRKQKPLKRAPSLNVDICKQYEIIKAVRFPNTWVDELEALAIIVFLLGVVGLLLYRSASI